MMSKWNPFNAVASGDYMINDVMKEKNKVSMPILSEDQKLELQNKMFEAFYNPQNNLFIKKERENMFKKMKEILYISQLTQQDIPSMKLFSLQELLIQIC